MRPERRGRIPDPVAAAGGGIRRARSGLIRKEEPENIDAAIVRC
jgi:hypothetical protein